MVVSTGVLVVPPVLPATTSLMSCTWSLTGSSGRGVTDADDESESGGDVFRFLRFRCFRLVEEDSSSSDKLLLCKEMPCDLMVTKDGDVKDDDWIFVIVLVLLLVLLLYE